MPVPFTIDFTAPGATGNLVATTLLQLYDHPSFPSSVRLTWNPIETAPENVEKIEIWAIDSYGATRIARFTDPAVSAFTYHYPRSAQNTTYQVIQFIRSGGNILVGLWGQASATVTLTILSIVSVSSPVSLRVAVDAWPTFREKLTQSQEWSVPAGGSDYVEQAGSLRGRDLSLSGQLYDRADGSNVTAQDTRAALSALFDTRDITCVRDPRGNKWFARFMGDIDLDYGKGGVRYNATWSMRRVAHAEGVAA